MVRVGDVETGMAQVLRCAEPFEMLQFVEIAPDDEARLADAYNVRDTEEKKRETPSTNLL